MEELDNIPVVNGTAAAIAAQTRQHKENLRIWKEHDNVTKALRKQHTHGLLTIPNVTQTSA
jgi:hypothetical protein